jgi:hypothetical protein
MDTFSLRTEDFPGIVRVEVKYDRLRKDWYTASYVLIHEGNQHVWALIERGPARPSSKSARLDAPEIGRHIATNCTSDSSYASRLPIVGYMYADLERREKIGLWPQDRIEALRKSMQGPLC